MKTLKFSACRTAQRRDDKAAFMLVEKQLRGLLTVFAGKLHEAGLAATEKLWMQFSLTQAYMQLGQCYDGLGNSQKVFKVYLLHLHALSWPNTNTVPVCHLNSLGFSSTNFAKCRLQHTSLWQRASSHSKQHAGTF